MNIVKFHFLYKFYLVVFKWEVTPQQFDTYRTYFNCYYKPIFDKYGVKTVFAMKPKNSASSEKYFLKYH